MLKLTDIASPFSGRQTEDVCIEDCFFFFDCHGGLLVLQCYSKLWQQQAQLVAVRPAVERAFASRDIQLCQQPQTRTCSPQNSDDNCSARYFYSCIPLHPLWILRVTKLTFSLETGNSSLRCVIRTTSTWYFFRSHLEVPIL